MSARLFYLVSTVMLVGCPRAPGPPPVPVGDDKSIVFPQFFGQAPVVVGAAEKSYELDGSFLRAVALAANDFRPPTAEKQPCWASQQALRYRVVRQGNIIFVRVDEEPELC